MPSEFELIRRYFTRPVRHTVLGVGDDCALMRLGDGMELAVSVDMLVAGTHFLADTDPIRLGRKTLAVNLSDMAAMGATPRWVTLAAALPAADEAWIAGFAEGFFGIADEHGVDVVGGDTTRGPLCLSVQIMGEVPRGRALLRSGARPGDEIWVSGSLGDAALGLAHLQHRVVLDPDEADACIARLENPVPRVGLGERLRGVAHSAIDISDGLLGDLGHILDASSVGAEIQFERLPLSNALCRRLDNPLTRRCALAGGDDYELCFTAPAAEHAAIERIGQALAVPLSCIGEVVGSGGLRVIEGGKPLALPAAGFDHFA